ncbi:MAG: hypothetical protein HPY44_06355 [Armatimonadetes bacterium]|nr:hypothetical protein [Armatimonadota bacterium]
MSPLHLLQAIWAALVLWYVLERLLVVKGRAVNAQSWRNPARAARDSWRALWDTAWIAWAFIAALLSAHTVTCVARGIWACGVSGWPQDLSAPCLQAFVDFDPSGFIAAFRSGEYWACRWRELLDAAIAYPAFRPALEPGSIMLLLGVTWWVQRRKLSPGAGDRRGGRARFAVSMWLLWTGLAAYLAQAAVNIRQFDLDEATTRGVGLLFGLFAAPVISGAVVGLLALLTAKIVLAQPIDADRLFAQWLQRLPRFATLCVLPAGAVALAGWFLPDWQQAPHPNSPGLAAGLWLFTRLAWLIALPGVLRVAVHGGPARRGLAELPRLLNAVPGGLVVLMLRSAAVLFPVLVALEFLGLLAPATGMLPGALTVLARWCVAFMVMGGSVALHRDISAAIGNRR